MDPEQLIAEFYSPGSKSHDILVEHSRQVAQKALNIAEKAAHLKPDTTFIWQAAMLHDIAIFMTDSPSLGCVGSHPYVAHGYLGRALLEEKDLAKHALVCERHVGAGITGEDIKAYGLPLPVRDMLPLTVEEKIICVADKFFSKKHGSLNKERSTGRVVNIIRRYGEENLKRFMEWLDLFGI